MDSTALSKVTGPFLQRATETKEKEPLISYYCQLYALQLGMDSFKKGVLGPEVEKMLIEHMDQLEKERQTLQQDPIFGGVFKSSEESYEYLVQFALKIFSKADEEDRHGTATIKTAKTFLASVHFLELLNVFAENRDSVEVQDAHEKIKYAKWRAAEISKGIRSGASIRPPPVNNLQQSSPNNEDIGSSTSPSSSISASISTPITTNMNVPVTTSPVPSATPRFLKSMDEAQKLAKYAANALQYEDIPSAKKFLRSASDILDALYPDA
jgi:vacuolar protein sorting-associated protein VTA1